MNSFTSLIIFFLSSSLLLLPTISTTPSGTIQRTTKQLILATIPPNSDQLSSPFLSSPSGKYTAYLIRHDTAPGAGGFGNDFCYIQVQDTSSGESVWESECAPASNENTCTLVFDDKGLEVFDGSNPIWDTGAESADDNPLEMLEMVDEGDMRIRDQLGELAWKASEDPRANQGCGLPGSAGLAPARPPFAEPIGGGRNLPFGQQPQQQSSGGVFNGEISQGMGVNGQPLVDHSAFYSGSSKGVEVEVLEYVGIEGHAHHYLGKEKVTQLHFFFHDTISGDNPSAVLVAQRNGTKVGNGSPGQFGEVYVIDDPLTESPDPNSKVVGHAQGLYMSAGQKELVLVFAVDFGFTSGEFNGSSISVLSRNPVLNTDRELAVVGGRGKFRMARGFANLHTYSINTIGDAVVEYNVTVFHYE
ncbi:hypothetical protein J5N97_021909 [Dioscorea zingiberensis]|uniref:Dirigent protein n=1 Tax=Dioscorea zingiberensis TaxID=325984 RepID=A0A9D5HAB4_9LILI|nr:hypothetical protein J5N97_021909 [Dioscorea zingiberensis]